MYGLDSFFRLVPLSTGRSVVDIIRCRRYMDTLGQDKSQSYGQGQGHSCIPNMYQCQNVC